MENTSEPQLGLTALLGVLKRLHWECLGATAGGRTTLLATTTVGDFYVYECRGRASFRLPIGGEEDIATVDDGKRECERVYVSLVVACFEL